MDTWSLDDVSIRLDVKILLRTLTAVFGRHGIRARVIRQHPSPQASKASVFLGPIQGSGRYADDGLAIWDIPDHDGPSADD